MASLAQRPFTLMGPFPMGKRWFVNVGPSIITAGTIWGDTSDEARSRAEAYVKALEPVPPPSMPPSVTVEECERAYRAAIANRQLGSSEPLDADDHLAGIEAVMKLLSRTEKARERTTAQGDSQ